MGEAERHIEYKNKYQKPGLIFNINSPVVLLICINFTVFLFIKILTFGNTIGDTAIAPFFYEKLNGLLIPTSFKSFFTQPWSIITYSFFHLYFFNLLSNMLWLWGFGSILQSLAGYKHTFPIYLYGAVAGALVFITVAQVSPSIQLFPLQGANAAVMAVAVAATTLAPDFRLFRHIGRGVPIWVLTVLYLIIDLVGMGTVSMHYYTAHLAGALIGFLYIIAYHRGSNWGAWMNHSYEWLMGLFNPNKQKKNIPVKEKIFYTTGQRSPYTKTANVTQQRIDEILDKISQRGYSSLNKEEKEILKRAGEE